MLTDCGKHTYRCGFTDTDTRCTASQSSCRLLGQQKTHLCQDLPRHDDDLHRLERNVPCHTLDQPLCLSVALARGCVRHDGDSQDESHHRENNHQHDAGRAARALAANEAKLCRVSRAADSTICSHTKKRVARNLCAAEGEGRNSKQQKRCKRDDKHGWCCMHSRWLKLPPTSVCHSGDKVLTIPLRRRKQKDQISCWTRVEEETGGGYPRMSSGRQRTPALQS